MKFISKLKLFAILCQWLVGWVPWYHTWYHFPVRVYRTFRTVLYLYHIYLLFSINCTQIMSQKRYQVPEGETFPWNPFFVYSITQAIFYCLPYLWKNSGKSWRATNFCQTLPKKEGLIPMPPPLLIDIFSKNYMKPYQNL